MSTNKIIEILGDQSDFLLNHTCKTIDKSLLHIPSPNTIDEIWISSDRNTRTLNSLQSILSHGRLANTGYVSILPVDQGVEHTAGASFAPNPLYFDPENIIKLAIEGGCNAVASTFGVLGAVARKYAHKIPFIVKINHNELLTYPTQYDQTLYGTVEDGVDYHSAADLTGQANHLGATIQADIVKQKLPTVNGGFTELKFGKTNEKVYTELTSSHPIDLCRYQVANSYMGRIGLINSGGESKGASDLKEAVITAVINKRAGGMGLISGRKAFQKPINQGVELLNAIQDVYLDKNITLA